MRFAFKICAATALCTAMLPCAAQGQSFSRAETSLQNLREPADLRRRAAGSEERPVLPKGLYAERVAASLGHITAMLSLPDGSIYALETDSGQLFHFIDRSLDGRMDSRRTLTSGFERPTGLTLKDGDLYVSDAQAIWRVDISTGIKTQFVSLRNVTAAEPRPLLTYKDNLLLGLTTSKTLSKVLSINGQTGVAMVLSEIPEGPLRSLSYGGGQLWAAAGLSLRPIDKQASTEFAKAYPLEAGAAAMAVMLPSSKTDWPKDWPPAMKDYVLAIQGPTAARAGKASSGGNNIAALPTQFGAPTENLSILAGGFLGRNGQSAWAAPTAMFIDSRGLFYADRIGGTLWRVAVDNRPPPKPRTKIGKAPPKMPVQKPSLKPNETPAMAGSMIGEASGLDTASTLAVGSRLKAEHDKKEAAKLAEEKAAEEVKAKTLSDAREARRLSRTGGN